MPHKLLVLLDHRHFINISGEQLQLSLVRLNGRLHVLLIGLHAD
jgi:hypothetical protein